MIPNSIGISMCNVVGRQLGAGDTKAAKQTATIALTFGTLIAIAYSGAIYVWGDRVASCFTDDEGVLSERLTIWPWAALFLVLDACVCSPLSLDSHHAPRHRPRLMMFCSLP
jgi:Na+-driven multidrug efflux pump